jgi:hypothetical protein
MFQQLWPCASFHSGDEWHRQLMRSGSSEVWEWKYLNIKGEMETTVECLPAFALNGPMEKTKFGIRSQRKRGSSTREDYGTRFLVMVDIIASLR